MRPSIVDRQLESSVTIVRWNITVSPDTDASVRELLGMKDEVCECELSRFVEEAVKARIFELTAIQAKAANADLGEDDLNAMIVEAVNWARASDH
jgi:hypothetical protein